MNTAFKISIIASVSLFIIWLYIVNCLWYNDYVFVYSENNYRKAFQYIVEGLWTILTMFGWMPIGALIVAMVAISFPNSFKDFKDTK